MVIAVAATAAMVAMAAMVATAATAVAMVAAMVAMAAAMVVDAAMVVTSRLLRSRLRCRLRFPRSNFEQHGPLGRTIAAGHGKFLMKSECLVV